MPRNLLQPTGGCVTYRGGLLAQKGTESFHCENVFLKWLYKFGYKVSKQQHLDF